MSRSDGAPSIQQSGQPSVLVAHMRVVGALLVREISLWSSALVCFAISLVIFTMLRRTFRQED